MRGVASAADCPLLFASTYQAGDFITLPSGDVCADDAAAEKKRTGACPRRQ